MRCGPAEEHVRTVERLMDKLEPQRRRMSRAEQLQGTMSELAEETSDPYLLAQAEIRSVWPRWPLKRHATQLERLKELGLSRPLNTFGRRRGLCDQGQVRF